MKGKKKHTPKGNVLKTSELFIKEYNHIARQFTRRYFLLIILEVLALGAVALNFKAQSNALEFFVIIAFVILIILSSHLQAKFMLSSFKEFDERTKRTLKSRNMFFSRLGHEFRTPINIMLGMNEMILNESTQLDVMEYSKSALHAGNSLQFMFNQLLLYSRYESGNLVPFNNTYYASRTFQDFLYYASTVSKDHNKRFKYSISEAVPDQVEGDEQFLIHMLYTLIRHVPTCSLKDIIKFSLDWEYTEDEVEGFVIGFSYTGMAIPKKALTLYDLFNVEATKDPTAKTESTIEIDIFYYILELLGGSLDITVTASGNTVIKVVIPMNMVVTQEEINEFTESEDAFTAEKASILIVDDNSFNLKIISLILKDTLIQIDTALSGADAIECVKKNKYDVILLDYLMPKKNGIETLQEMKQAIPDLLDTTTIFALTASLNEDIKNGFLSEGATDFITKPIEAKLLLRLIKNSLSKDLVRSTALSTSKLHISDREIEMYSQMLGSYSVILDAGLKYMSNDFVQYATTIQIFIKNMNRNINALLQAVEKEDIKAFEIAAHSLKSNAKLIGAIPLHYMSLYSETSAANSNWEYVRLVTPLLVYQLKYTCEGLNLFLADFKKKGYMPIVKRTSNATKDSYKKKAEEYISSLQSRPAALLLQSVIDDELDPDNDEKIKNIIEYIEELEYDKASQLLKELN